ncbi:MAG: hypothetical protein IT454_06325 [Planctomycetes bacterium]|nr:hypothetical protein [Planctomycetota bacterium]
MVQINFAQKQVSAKIVYYGPGMSGKTTNLEVVHQRAPDQNKGELTSISTDGDRTLFFDFMPLDLGTVAGMRTSFQIYTVPGQVYYNSTRKLVLQGVDGVVFVADSSTAMLQENLESLRNLEENLNEYGKSLATTPHVIQFNKRDLPDAMSIEELNQHLNPYGAPYFEAVANTGQGVFPTLKALAARVLESIHSGAQGGAGVPAPRAPAPAPQAQAPRAPMPAPQAQRGLPNGTRGAMEQQPAAALPQQGAIAMPQMAPIAAAQAQNAGYAAQPQQVGRAGYPPQQAPAMHQTGFHAPQPAPVGQTGFHSAPQAPVQGGYAQPMQPAPQMMPPPMQQAHPQMAPQMHQHMAPQMQAPTSMQMQAPMAMGHAPLEAPPQQQGYAQQQQAYAQQQAFAQQQGYAQPAQGYAPQQPQNAAPLQMASRPSPSVGAAQPIARAPAAPTSKPAQSTAAAAQPRPTSGPLEGTRFRPRTGGQPAPRVEPRPTPIEKSSSKLYVGLFVAAAVILAVGLTFVVMSFL